ncbi:GNAT family N-acetyltransferase [Sandaracinus amylolyticus]|uniref:Acetyltransferase, GNAT family n=1 Tax=Sandaracinus amylolyticus TaxID=927083 RepID=A0A0F6YJE1_9BACT|nr:GNAT family N-acetyltransferase [Sandaracinus amylolyticus]AKF07710.1 Acetyltransferase, GNAT family [Sandaracinus amylolyticus]
MSAERYVELALDPMSRVTLRPMTDADRPFLERLYASTREEELRPVPWSDAQKTAFLASQYALQHAHYQQHYDGARFDVIEEDGAPIGRLYLSRGEREIRIVDIALIPSHRGRGIGASLIERVIARARKEGASVTIHVERNNPALRLYERLGFRVEEDRGVYLFLAHSAGRA